jgi:hypothetical protein
MKLIYGISLSLGLLIFQSAKAQSSRDYTVQARVVVSKTPPSISLRWPKIASGVTRYNIYRKAKDESSWGAKKYTADGLDTMWTDTNVVVGKVYEYNIQRVGTYNGNTYILSGIDVPVIHNRGNALVLIEKDLATAVAAEFDAYLKDIAADGWKVYALQVSKTDSVQFVKREIKRFHKFSGGLKSLIIIGHVPVPYSGNFGADPYYTVPPDGHPDHVGCWPTDTYYAIDFDEWADGESNTVGSRAENKNLPGDSKFDNIEIPGSVRFYTGRVDLSNMPKFALNEAELTKQYFKKAHDFRYKITQTVEKGVIDENFDAATYGAFASTGWRNFSVMFGPKNIIEADLLTTCATENLLFSYGAGGGSYTSCGGVGTTDDFTTKKAAVFNMLFGSYFGDWDIANNILRAPLAASENGLTNAWSGRPYWQNHPMALGDPIGYCALLTQNNTTTYSYNVFANIVSINLMGDPTLRLHMIEPPTKLMTTAKTNNTEVDLSWTASKEAGILGYYIYRSSSPYGNYFPINSTPLSATTYTDKAPFQGTNYYLVKTVKLTQSASGTYYNTSHGTGANISGITGQAASIQKALKVEISIFPNPAKSALTIQFSEYNNSESLQILNVQGQLVKQVKLELNHNNISNSIDVSDLASGLYILKAGNISTRFVKE